MMSENGPYRPDPSDPANKLVEDEYSWNKVANVIWLESPAGVGFSYSHVPSDYTVGDERTANDTYAFLQIFFSELFPQFQPNDFYVSGESYGGHYVPNACARIFAGNDASPRVHINLKGLLEGNPWTDMPLDNLGSITTWSSRAVASEESVQDIISHCNLSYVGPLRSNQRSLSRDAQCDAAINAAMETFVYVDIYDLYVDICENNPSMLMLRQMSKVSWLHQKIYQQVMRRRQLKKQGRSNPPLPPVDPCIDNDLTSYLNNLAVQKAINAVPPHASMPIVWAECSSVVEYNFDDVAKSVVPVLKGLFARPDFHAVVYSGDVDGIVAVSGTLLWIKSIGRPVVKPWHVWLDENNQAGGFATVYDQFTFTTIRGAGHMCPLFQPARTFQMFSSWLANHTIQ